MSAAVTIAGELPRLRGSWTAAEDLRLRELHPTHSQAQLATALGRTVGAVRTRCWTLGLNDKGNPWTDADLAALRAAYGDGAGAVDLGALAKTLGRLKSNVSRKARALGLTDRRRPMIDAVKQNMAVASAKRIKDYGHPRGALGMKHTAASLAKISAASRAAWADPGNKLNSPEHRQAISDRAVALRVAGKWRQGGHSRCASGKRPDLGGQFFRSSWEANYARYLNLLKSQGRIRDWQYEVHTFVFEKIKRGTRMYTPDFKVLLLDGTYEWHEVKGWMDQPSKTRLKRMAKYFPSELVKVIGKPWFSAANRSGLAASLPGWERGGKK